MRRRRELSLLRGEAFALGPRCARFGLCRLSIGFELADLGQVASLLRLRDL